MPVAWLGGPTLYVWQGSGGGCSVQCRTGSLDIAHVVRLVTKQRILLLFEENEKRNVM